MFVSKKETVLQRIYSNLLTGGVERGVIIIGIPFSVCIVAPMNREGKEKEKVSEGSEERLG